MHRPKQIGPAEDADHLVVIQHRDDPLIPFDHLVLDIFKRCGGCGQENIPEHDVIDAVSSHFVVQALLYRFPSS